MCRGEHAFPSLIKFATHHIQDAVLAAKAGVDGILISNHGGELPQRPLFPILTGSVSGRQLE